MRPLTRPCLLLFLLRRLFLLSLSLSLKTCLPSLWSPPFLLHAPALVSLFLANMRFSLTLTLSPLMIWCFGQTALFLFLLARAAPAYLPTAVSIALRPLFSLQLNSSQICEPPLAKICGNFMLSLCAPCNNCMRISLAKYAIKQRFYRLSWSIYMS